MLYKSANSNSKPMLRQALAVRRRTASSEHGATLIEAALTLPLLLILIIGIVQYGFIFAAHVTLRSAASVTARAAGIIDVVPCDGGEAATITLAQEALGSLLDAARLQVSATDANVITDIPEACKVTLTYDLPLFFPLVVPRSTGGILTITAEAIMG